MTILQTMCLNKKQGVSEDMGALSRDSVPVDEHLLTLVEEASFDYGYDRPSDRRVAARRSFYTHGVARCPEISQVVCERVSAPAQHKLHAIVCDSFWPTQAVPTGKCSTTQARRPALEGRPSRGASAFHTLPPRSAASALRLTDSREQAGAYLGPEKEVERERNT